MRGLILLGLMLATPVAGPVAAQSGKTTPAMAAVARTGVQAMIDASAAGWNAGSLDRFVAIYAPDATYVGKNGLIQGRAAIADLYRPSFTDGANKRGKLAFETLGSRMISPAHLLLWARWTLTPADPDLKAGGKAETGITSLLFEHRPEGWRIISDHST